MRKRLQELMDKEGISPARFAELVGVQRSSVSHILSGRNNPSLEFIQKILSAFPKISSDWLISGIGSIYRESTSDNQNKMEGVKTATNQSTADLFSVLNDEDISIYRTPEESKSTSETKPIQKVITQVKSDTVKEEKNIESKPENKQIYQIVVFYSDDTFKVYHNNK